MSVPRFSEQADDGGMVPMFCLQVDRRRNACVLVSPREPADALTQNTPAYCREPVMPITRLLADGSFTPEQRHVLELAFNNTLRKLHLVDRNDPLCELVAQRIIDIHRRGASDAVAISEIAVRELRFPECG
jgi:hypothetical protein